MRFRVVIVGLVVLGVCAANVSASIPAQSAFQPRQPAWMVIEEIREESSIYRYLYQHNFYTVEPDGTVQRDEYLSGKFDGWLPQDFAETGWALIRQALVSPNGQHLAVVVRDGDGDPLAHDMMAFVYTAGKPGLQVAFPATLRRFELSWSPDSRSLLIRPDSSEDDIPAEENLDALYVYDVWADRLTRLNLNRSRVAPDNTAQFGIDPNAMWTPDSRGIIYHGNPEQCDVATCKTVTNLVFISRNGKPGPRVTDIAPFVHQLEPDMSYSEVMAVPVGQYGDRFFYLIQAPYDSYGDILFDRILVSVDLGRGDQQFEQRFIASTYPTSAFWFNRLFADQNATYLMARSELYDPASVGHYVRYEIWRRTSPGSWEAAYIADHNEPARRPALSPDGRTVVVVGNSPNQFEFIDLETSQRLTTFQITPTEDFLAMAWLDADHLIYMTQHGDNPWSSYPASYMLDTTTWTAERWPVGLLSKAWLATSDGYYPLQNPAEE